MTIIKSFPCEGLRREAEEYEAKIKARDMVEAIYGSRVHERVESQTQDSGEKRYKLFSEIGIKGIEEAEKSIERSIFYKHGIKCNVEFIPV